MNIKTIVETYYKEGTINIRDRPSSKENSENDTQLGGRLIVDIIPARGAGLVEI